MNKARAILNVIRTMNEHGGRCDRFYSVEYETETVTAHTPYGTCGISKTFGDSLGVEVFIVEEDGKRFACPCVESEDIQTAERLLHRLKRGAVKEQRLSFLDAVVDVLEEIHQLSLVAFSKNPSSDPCAQLFERTRLDLKSFKDERGRVGA